jgi:hypothetical protein
MSDEYPEDVQKEGDNVTSGDATPDPANSPTTPDDEGKVGDGTGEGDAGPASGSTTVG